MIRRRVRGLWRESVLNTPNRNSCLEIPFTNWGFVIDSTAVIYRAVLISFFPASVQWFSFTVATGTLTDATSQLYPCPVKNSGERSLVLIWKETKGILRSFLNVVGVL